MKFKFLSLLFLTSSVFAGEYDTPEQAIKTLEKAYAEQKMDKALEARDFEAEAKLMVLNLKPELASEPEVLRQTAEVLMLGTKQEYSTGLPNFSGLKCTLSEKTKIEHDVIRFNEICIFPDNNTSEQLVYAYKGNKGWRYIAYIPKQ